MRTSFAALLVIVCFTAAPIAIAEEGGGACKITVNANAANCAPLFSDNADDIPDVCDCANFVNGAYSSCCEFDQACSVSFSGGAIAGCTADMKGAEKNDAGTSSGYSLEGKGIQVGIAAAAAGLYALV